MTLYGLRLAARRLSATAAPSTASASAQPKQVFYGTAGRYAHALYNAAVKASALPQVTADVAEFQSLRKSSPEFDGFLLNPTVSRALKTSALEAVLGKAKLSPTFSHFVLVVSQNGRSTETPAILSTFEAIMASEKGEITAMVKSTVPLTEWQTALLKKRLVARFYPDNPDTDIQVDNAIEPELLGGMTIQMEDKFIDMSWKKEVAKLKDLVMEGV